MEKLPKSKLYQLVKEALVEKNLIQEMSSYNRVRDHIEGGSAFVIMSSDRHERSGSENKQMYQQMKQEFASAGFPFTELKGGFKETTKTETDPETGEEVEVELEEPIHVTENSILVTAHPRGPNAEENTSEDLFNFAKQVSQKYNQEAFIFGEGATTSRGDQVKVINAYDKDGGKIEDSWAGPWSSVETVSRDADFWSRASGKHFQLKESKKTTQPKSWYEAMKKSKQGLKW
jgi:hypothetical protein